nr:hypothetical protein [Tanacetum cinerariifolium]
YALMIKPTIYVSCIKKFSASTTIKKVNDVVKLQALIDGKRVVITERVGKGFSGVETPLFDTMLVQLQPQAAEEEDDVEVNDVVKLQALIDGKRVVITEDVIRQALHLDDADGVECLPNEDIFTELARMGYEKPPHKLTFYKDLFSTQ